jgi:hypothetical protein
MKIKKSNNFKINIGKKILIEKIFKIFKIFSILFKIFLKYCSKYS